MPRITLRRRNDSDEEDIQDVNLKWSKRRILIAVTLVALVFGGIVYALSLDRGAAVLGVGEKNNENAPQIEIPSQEEVVDIIEQAKENLSNINVNDVVSSQPQIQKVISDLEQLTKTDKNAKNAVCNMVCK